MRAVAWEYEERNKSAQEWLRYERGDVCISNKTPAWQRRDTITGAKGHGSGEQIDTRAGATRHGSGSERTRERERKDTGAGAKGHGSESERTRERERKYTGAGAKGHGSETCGTHEYDSKRGRPTGQVQWGVDTRYGYITAPEREGTRAEARGGNTAMRECGREGVRDGRSPRRGSGQCAARA